MTSKQANEYPDYHLFFLLGTNMGQRAKNLEKARTLIQKYLNPVVRASSIYESEAWGLKDQDSFLNQVIEIHTQIGPWEVLSIIGQIESDMGRERVEKWGPRLIDIDLLYYEDIVISSFDLQVPHPGIADRRFTLLPLAELIPDMAHPKLKIDQKTLLQNCEDRGWVKVWEGQ